jgi:hypothetical protein
MISGYVQDYLKVILLDTCVCLLTRPFATLLVRVGGLGLALEVRTEGEASSPLRQVGSTSTMPCRSGELASPVCLARSDRLSVRAYRASPVTT